MARPGMLMIPTSVADVSCHAVSPGLSQPGSGLSALIIWSTPVSGGWSVRNESWPRDIAVPMCDAHSRSAPALVHDDPVRGVVREFDARITRCPRALWSWWRGHRPSELGQGD